MKKFFAIFLLVLCFLFVNNIVVKAGVHGFMESQKVETFCLKYPHEIKIPLDQDT